MCGYLDEGVQIDEEIYARYLMFARHYGTQPGGASKRNVKQLAQQDSPAAYMEALFSDLLQAGVNDTSSITEGQRADAIANQVIVLARLAGFMAGQFPPETDLYRGAMEAFADGFAEPKRLIREMQGHHHGHSYQ